MIESYFADFPVLVGLTVAVAGFVNRTLGLKGRHASAVSWIVPALLTIAGALLDLGVLGVLDVYQAAASVVLVAMASNKLVETAWIAPILERVKLKNPPRSDAR